MDGITLGSNGRRRFLQALGVGSAAVALPLAASASAAPAATTTTAPPKRPVGGDAALLAFAESVERTAMEAYATVIRRADSKVISADATQMLVLHAFHEHHRSYADAIAALNGSDAARVANAALWAEIEGGFTGPLDAALAAAEALENTAVATHGTLVGQLLGTDAAALLSSIMVIEARHATTIAGLIGSAGAVPGGPLDDLSQALLPENYPVL